MVSKSKAMSTACPLMVESVSSVAEKFDCSRSRVEADDEERLAVVLELVALAADVLVRDCAGARLVIDVHTRGVFDDERRRYAVPRGAVGIDRAGARNAAGRIACGDWRIVSGSEIRTGVKSDRTVVDEGAGAVGTCLELVIAADVDVDDSLSAPPWILKSSFALAVPETFRTPRGCTSRVLATVVPETFNTAVCPAPPTDVAFEKVLLPVRFTAPFDTCTPPKVLFPERVRTPVPAFVNSPLPPMSLFHSSAAFSPPAEACIVIVVSLSIAPKPPAASKRLMRSQSR